MPNAAADRNIARDYGESSMSDRHLLLLYFLMARRYGAALLRCARGQLITRDAFIIIPLTVNVTFIMPEFIRYAKMLTPIRSPDAFPPLFDDED